MAAWSGRSLLTSWRSAKSREAQWHRLSGRAQSLYHWAAAEPCGARGTAPQSCGHRSAGRSRTSHARFLRVSGCDSCTSIGIRKHFCRQGSRRPQEPRGPQALQGIRDAKTIFVFILRPYMPLSLSFFQKCMRGASPEAEDIGRQHRWTTEHVLDSFFS